MIKFVSISTANFFIARKWVNILDYMFYYRSSECRYVRVFCNLSLHGCTCYVRCIMYDLISIHGSTSFAGLLIDVNMVIKHWNLEHRNNKIGSHLKPGASIHRLSI